MDFKKYYNELVFDVNNNIPFRFTAKQSDTKSRGFNVKIIQNGVLVPVTTESMTFYALKPDGTKVFDQAVNDNGHFRIDLHNQVFAVKGLVKCELLLIGGSGEQISSKTFEIIVDETIADDSFASEDVLLSLDEILESNAAVQASILELYDEIINPNYIINGSMSVWQRGVSFSGNNVYTADRWKTLSIGSSILGVSKSNDAPDGIGLNHSAYLKPSSGDSDTIFSQLIEDVKLLSNRTITVSFYAKTDSSNKTIAMACNQYFGAGGSGWVHNIGLVNKTITNAWQKFSVTLTLQSVTNKTIGIGNFTELMFYIPATTIGLYITGIKVELGKKATQLHCTYAEELRNCQRYYEVVGYLPKTLVPQTTPIIDGQFMVKKRTTPTLNVASVNNVQDKISYWNGSSWIDLNVTDKLSFTGESMYRIVFSSNIASLVLVSATITADAEL